MSVGARAAWVMLTAALVVVLWPLPAQAAATIVLEQPSDRAVVHGAPALVPVVVAAEQPWATDLRVELDGHAGAALLPWSRQTILRLEPGLHQVAVVGVDARSGAPTRSSTLQVAVFAQTKAAAAAGVSPRERHGLTAVFAFMIAIGGATILRRRGAR